jgi:hypothetical protein
MFNKVKVLTGSVIEKIEALNDEYKSEIASHKLSQRNSLINPEEFITDNNFIKTTEIYKKFLEHLEVLEKKQADVNDNDDVRDVIISIFKNKIGTSFQKTDLEDIYKEGALRYAEKRPPGFMDSHKKGSYYFEEKEYKRKYGDLLLWKEIINHSKSHKLKYVVLVTGDLKDDWWEEKRGRKIGARKELLNEIYEECPDLEVFYLYNTSSFLKFAKQEIDNSIKDSSINETLDLISNNKNRLGTLEEVSPAKTDFLNQLYSINESIKLNHLRLQESTVQLAKLKNYREDLYANSDPLDDIREHAHNLAYSENDWEETINELQSKLSIDMELQMRLLEKLRLEN